MLAGFSLAFSFQTIKVERVIWGSLNGTGGKVSNEETIDPATLFFDAYEAIDFNSFLKVLFT